jgi:hypothetical protein
MNTHPRLDYVGAQNYGAPTSKRAGRREILGFDNAQPVKPAETVQRGLSE